MDAEWKMISAGNAGKRKKQGGGAEKKKKNESKRKVERSNK